MATLPFLVKGEEISFRDGQLVERNDFFTLWLVAGEPTTSLNDISTQFEAVAGHF